MMLPEKWIHWGDGAMTEPKKRLPNGMGIAFGMGLGFILGWLLNEVVWGLAIGIFIGTWVDYFAQRR